MQHLLGKSLVSPLKCTSTCTVDLSQKLFLNNLYPGIVVFWICLSNLSSMCKSPETLQYFHFPASVPHRHKNCHSFWKPHGPPPVLCPLSLLFYKKRCCLKTYPCPLTSGLDVPSSIHHPEVAVKKISPPDFVCHLKPFGEIVSPIALPRFFMALVNETKTNTMVPRASFLPKKAGKTKMHIRRV